MATFVRVGDKTKALVRKQGFPTKTFLRLADSRKWAKKLEADIEDGLVGNSFFLRHHTLEIEAGKPRQVFEKNAFILAFIWSWATLNPASCDC